MNRNLNVIRTLRRTLLIVEDEPINQEILSAILSATYEVIIADDGVEALSALKTSLNPISLILLDINMPVMGGIEFLKIVKDDPEYERIPVILLTSEKESELEALELGAADFISKPYNLPEIILARVRRSIELSEDRMIIQAAERDELTGVYNKEIFMNYVKKMDEYHVSSDSDTVVLNIEKFHLYNELYGREEGDRAIVSLAEVLKAMVRENNGIVGRLSGDYFVMYLVHRANYDDFHAQIGEMLKSKYGIEHLRFRLGAYKTVDKEEPIESRIDRAKMTCDHIRGSIRLKTARYSETVRDDVLLQEKLIQGLREGVEKRQFKVYFQPKVAIQGEKRMVSSAEALVRWIHPELGFISPGVFIPLFESNGSIRFVDEFVWKEAAKQIKEWKTAYGRVIPISVNVSRVDLFDEHIVDTLTNIVLEAGIAPEDLYLEVTESAYNEESDQMNEIITALKERGFKIEIDDFGSGYSSLNTLATLPFDVLKLDMQFVRQMFQNEKTMRMVEIVAEIAKLLHVTLVAEGVETAEQCETLRKLGYDIIQGYLFSKPVPAPEFEPLIQKEF